MRLSTAIAAVLAATSWPWTAEMGEDGQCLMSNGAVEPSFQACPGGTPDDADATTKGILQLADDLGGTAASPDVVDVTCAGSCISDAEVDNGITVDLAATATALAANPAPCGAGEFVNDIAANGTLSCAAPAGGAGKSFFAGKSSASLTADISCAPAGYDVCAAASAVNQIPLPFSGTFRNLYLVMATAPANGSSCKLLVRTGACSTGTLADTALACTVVGNGSLRTCSDTSNTAAGTAGQCVQLFYDETGTCTGQIFWGFEYAP